MGNTVPPCVHNYSRGDFSFECCCLLVASGERTEVTILMNSASGSDLHTGISSHLWTSGSASTDNEQVETDLTGSHVKSDAHSVE